jgi:hypothetical protein
MWPVIVWGLAIWAGGCSGKESEVRKTARSALARSAEEYFNAVRTGDYARQAQMMDPLIAKGLGGRDKLEESIRKAAKEMTIVPESLKAEDPGQTVADGDVALGAVGYSLSMDTRVGRLEIHSSIIGISIDQGQTWRFIAGNKNGRELVANLYPKAAANLRVPESYGIAPDGNRMPL